MTDRPQTEYRGHVIWFSDNSDEWYCSDFNFSHVKLSKVRERIDTIYLKMRKAAALPCFEFDGHHRKPNLIPSTIIEYVKEVFEGGGWSGGERKLVNHEVAVIAHRGGNDRASRRKTNISNLIADIPETYEMMPNVLALYAKKIAAEKAYADATDKLPRVSVDMISDLIKIHASEGEAQE